MDKETQRLTLSITTNNPESVCSVCDEMGATIWLDDASIEYCSSSKKLGMGETCSVIVVVVNFGMGVAASYLASWIYEKLGQNSKNEILVKEEREIKILINEHDIEVLISEKIEKQKRNL